jgi:hypothetical protein
MDPIQQPPTQQNPIPQQPTSQIPSSASKWKLVLLIILLIMGGLGIYYLGAKGNKTQLPKNKIIAMPTQTQTISSMSAKPNNAVTPTIPQNILNAITVVPRHADQFKKTILVNGNCNYPFGLVTYQDKASDSQMKINSLKLFFINYSLKGPVEDAEENRNRLLKVNSFLDENKLTPYQDFFVPENPFSQGECTGAGTPIYIKELPNILYPNTDKSRTIMTYVECTDGCDLKDVKIIVLARKGDNFIRLEKILGLSVLTADHNLCGFQQSDYSSYNSAEMKDCYKKTLTNDKNLEVATVKEAKNMIALFSIKN